ncbi:hypothetical protein [Chitinimonas taiwanensis]|uniref:hypothetical protein n=1 Tax=Chitinimonas taiwanensis TaxID=240412 RepID=UPI0035ADBD4C
MKHALRPYALLTGLLLLAGCASAPVAPSAPVSQPAEVATPAPAPAPVAPLVTAPVATPTPAVSAPASAGIIGSWEGKWTIESMGYEGKTVVVIEQVNGNAVSGRATMFDTPYGDLTEDFAPATFDGSKLNVKHANNASYVLTLSEKDGKPRLVGPLVYITDAGTYNGTIRVSKK